MSKSKTHRLDLHIVLIPEGGGWVAQALQRDFAGQGHSRQAALSALAHTIGSHVYASKGRGIDDPLALVPAAPEMYWDLFEQAEKPETP